jgi:hypothetical protein
VLVAQLVAFIQGEVEAQAQHVSNTTDPTVTSQPVTGDPLAAISSVVTGDGPGGTDLGVDVAGPDGLPAGQLAVRIRRILQPDADGAPAGDDSQPCLSGTWRLGDGTRVHGIFATVRHTPC